MGAPKHNANAMKNGTRLMRLLVLGELPECMRRVSDHVLLYRRRLEAETFHASDANVVLPDDLTPAQRYLAIEAELTTTQKHLIHEASVNQQHAGICKWLLRERIDTMTVSDIASCSREITRAAAQRNRAVSQLRLDVRPADPWAALDALPADSEEVAP